MMKDKFFRLMLIVIAVLLVLNLVSQRIAVSTSSEALAQAKSAASQSLPGGDRHFGRFAEPGIVCSSDGKYVYLVGRVGGDGSLVVYRSTDFGKPGSWECVASS